jgi:hypothetical protein
MPQFRARVNEVATAGQHWVVRCAGLAGPAAAPGQFYLALVESDLHPLLREPVFPVAAGPGACEFWLAEAHPLATLSPNDTLDLVGPLGRAAQWPARARRLLLASRGPERLWPLMTWAVAQGWSVAWWWPDGVPAGLLSALPSTVEAHTGDLAAEAAVWADVAVLDVAEPAPVARRLRSLGLPRAAGFVLAYQLPVIPCGFGGCQACWVGTGRGRRLACLDGPFLPL